jgi:hypothetical protein
MNIKWLRSIPDVDTRNALREVFLDALDAFKEDVQSDFNATGVAPSNSDLMALRHSYLRPSADIQKNVWFTMYWSWMYLWTAYPLPLTVGLSVIAVFTAANLYTLVKGLFA